MIGKDYLRPKSYNFVNMNQAARWLKEIREDRGLSFRELGKATKLAHQTISDAEEAKSMCNRFIVA